MGGPDFLRDRAVLVALGVAAIALFACTNLPWQLDDYDQAKQAFASFELVKEGRWFYQHTPDNHVATKPPLVAWSSVAVFAIARSWDVAWRLPSFACAMGIVVVLLRTATRAYTNTAGVIVASAFAFNPLTPRLATLVRSDMPLAFVILLIGVKIFEKVRTREPWNSRDRVAMFVLLTASMLIKGPIVYAFILPGIVAFQLLRRDRTATAWSGWWPWVASLAVFGAWVGGGIATMPNFYEEVVLREFAGRFTQTVHRPQPVYYYLPHLLAKFLPWSAAIVALALVAHRERGQRLRDSIRTMPPHTLWLAVWIIGGIVVMSVIPSKRVDRIFAVVPPLCLLVGAQFASFGNRERSIARSSAAVIVVAVLLTTGFATARVVTGYRTNRNALSEFGREVRALAQHNSWRLEVVGKTDEGAPLYFDRPHFTPPDGAIAGWNSGTIDALAVPLDKLERFQRELSGVGAPRMSSTVRGELPDRPSYVLLVR